MAQQTKLSFAPNVIAISSGREASRSSLPKRDSLIPQGAARHVATSASAEILRACDLLRTILLRDDEELSDSEPDVLVGQVSAGLNDVIDRLQSLAGLQMMFEAWNKS